MDTTIIIGPTHIRPCPIGDGCWALNQEPAAKPTTPHTHHTTRHDSLIFAIIFPCLLPIVLNLHATCVTFIAARFARTSAAAMTGETEFPHILTCASLVRVLPSTSISIW